MRPIDSELLAIAAELIPDGSDNLNGLLTALVRDVSGQEVVPRRSVGHISANEDRSRTPGTWFSLRRPTPTSFVCGASAFSFSPFLRRTSCSPRPR